MYTQRIRPSRTRAVGPRELDFLMGTPSGDFVPEPFYLVDAARTRPTLGDELAYVGEVGDGLPFRPDPSHSATHGSVWRYRPIHAPEPLHERITSVLTALALSLAVMGATLVALARLIGP